MSDKFSLAKTLLKVGLVGIVTTILFSGCSTTLQTQREIGTLNLTSKKLKQLKPTKRVIAIISPKIAGKKQQTQAPKSRLEIMMMQRMGNMNANYNFDSAFSKNYARRLNNALEDSVSEIISAKGFKLKGPYKELDDMTYQDKKKVYLAFVPKIDFTIENKVINTKRHRLYTHSDGVIQIGGNVIISMLEPMTGQVFIKRRISLSDFNIQEPYVYEKQISDGSGGLIGTAIDKSTAPKKLIDTTDVALAKAINEFYAKTIQKVNAYLDKEEILSFKEDILKLKGLKRF